MCLSPIDIINPNKYVSLKHRDAYLLQVPCGKCAECQKLISSQWQYRTYYEFSDCLANGGFIMYDTLTYRDKSLKHISDFISCKSEYDYPCFSRADLKNFFKLLRMRTKRLGYHNVVYRYFVSSEYGSVEKTFRPHYHLLLFVIGDIEPITVSRLISDCWIHGRTDGAPYKSESYVIRHNTIRTSSLSNILRTINYVTKYVQKNCRYQYEINRRIENILFDIAEQIDATNECDLFGETKTWLDYFQCSDLRKELNRLCNQFHMQSLHFGESALSEIDMDQLFEDGSLIMPDFKKVKLPVVLPTYYKRKLFYKLIEIDGTKSWQLTDLGKQYKEYRTKKLQSDLESRLEAACLDYNLPFDCKKLADYVCNYRGKIKGSLSFSTLEERLKDVTLFNYSTYSDKLEFGKCGVSPIFLGNNSIGYSSRLNKAFIPIKQFIANYVYLDDEKEKELDTIYYNLSKRNKSKQDLYELKQRLVNVYKCFV